MRLSYDHLVEALEALEALGRWRQHSTEVRQFLKGLPTPVTRSRAEAEACLKKVAGGAVQRVRHRTFHYPSPNPSKQPDFDSELRTVLYALRHQQAIITAPIGSPQSLRLTFADDVALPLAIGRDQMTEEETRKELNTVLNGSIAFAHFVDGALAAYLAARQ